MKQFIRSFSGWMGIVLGLVALGVVVYIQRSFVHNDVYISLRYAVNFAETGLLQWNPGQWVEGYTSLLHVVLSGVGIRMGIDPLMAARGVNTVSSVGIILAAYAGARALQPADETSTLVPGIVAFAVGASHPIGTWLMGGLETTMTAALLVSGLACVLWAMRDLQSVYLWCAALFFSAAVLTRLDAAVFIAGTGLGLLLMGPGTPWRRFWAAVLVVGLPASVALIQIAVRIQVYGELFPMTFYAKVDLPLSERLQAASTYVFNSVDQVPVLSFAVVLGVIILALRRFTGAAALLALPIALHIGYVFWAGGDHMPAARMLVVLIAPAVLLVMTLGYALSPRWAIAFASLAVAVSLAADYNNRRGLRTDGAAFVGRIVGPYIDRTWPRDILIASPSAGALMFFSREGRYFIDTLGLNEPAIGKRKDVPMRAGGQKIPGHAKGDGAYVLSRAPDRIIIGPTEGKDVSNASDWFLTGVELGEIPLFHECYTKQVEAIPFTAKRHHRGRGEREQILTFTYYQRVCDPEELVAN